MLWALCQPFLYILSHQISFTPLCNTLFYENPNMSKSMKPKFKEVQQFAQVQTVHKCKARPDCRAQHLPMITQACYQIIVLHSLPFLIGSGKQAFMIKITFVYHTLPTFLRLYFMQRTTSVLLFILIKDKRDLYNNRSLTIKIYFIFFGKETNIYLAHWTKLPFGWSLEMRSLRYCPSSIHLPPPDPSPPFFSSVSPLFFFLSLSHQYCSSSSYQLSQKFCLI